jgi:HEAT repeat protein
MVKEGQAAAASTGAPGPPILKALEDMLVTLRKSSKDLAFYPPGHPLLSRSLENAAAQLHAVVDLHPPLALVVSRAGFTFEGQPVGKENRQLTTMAGELFVRRIHQIFFAQNISSEELAGFLRMATSDPKQLVQQGGPAKVLAAHAVGRIQVNEFDFQRVGAATGVAGRGTGGAGKPGAAGSGQGAGPGGSTVGTGGPGAAGGTASARAGVGSLAGGMTPSGAGVATADEASALPGAGVTLTPGGKEGSGAPGTPKASEEGGQGPATAESLAAALGSSKELTVEALIQRLEQEAASGGTTGYEWAALRLEKAVGRAIRDDWLQDVLAILRVFLRHRRADDLKEPIRDRAAQAVETVAGGNTASYLIEHLRGEGEESARELSGLLVELGARAISPLLGRLAAEDKEDVRERLAATVVRFHEAAESDLTRALRGLHRDQACHLVPILGEIGGEAGVALLSSLFRHGDARVRAEVTREVGRSDGPLAQRLLAQALRDSDPDVLEVAIALAGAAQLKLAVPTLLRLAGQRVLTGRAFALRKAAVAALGAMGDPVAVPTLRGALYVRTWFHRAAGDELRQTAALALLALGRPEAREVVASGARSRKGDVRRACTAAARAAAAKK